MNIERIKEIQSSTGYPDSVSIQQALFQVWNEVAQENKQVTGYELLTDKEMEILITRLTPSLYDVVLDGVDESKIDLFRKLRIIINDIITTKGNNMENTEVNKSYAQQLVDEYFDNYKTEKPSESDLPIILSIVEFMLKKFYYVTDESEQTISEPIPPKTQNLYVYVTELLKEDAEPYRDGKKEAIHEIPISHGLPIELVYGLVVGELERTYTSERLPKVTEFEITKIMFALDAVELLRFNVKEGTNENKETPQH